MRMRVLVVQLALGLCLLLCKRKQALLLRLRGGLCTRTRRYSRHIPLLLLLVLDLLLLLLGRLLWLCLLRLRLLRLSLLRLLGDKRKNNK